MAMGLTVENVEKDFPTRGGPLPVLRGISLALESGDALAVMGPSGPGKSTLLHILGTLDAPTRGRVTLDGTDPFALAEPALAAFRNRRIGFVTCRDCRHMFARPSRNRNLHFHGARPRVLGQYLGIS